MGVIDVSIFIAGLAVGVSVALTARSVISAMKWNRLDSISQELAEDVVKEVLANRNIIIDYGTRIKLIKYSKKIARKSSTSFFINWLTSRIEYLERQQRPAMGKM